MQSPITGLRLLLVLSALTGLIYPVMITLVGKALFPYQVDGSLVRINGNLVGSSLIGQKFTQSKYFWGRPSAVDNNPLPSGGSNLAPTSKKMTEFIREQEHKLSATRDLPQDLLFASASGLDPDISPQAAEFQIDRILDARGWNHSKRQTIQALIRRHTAPRQMGFLGENRVNILALNLALDGLG